MVDCITVCVIHSPSSLYEDYISVPISRQEAEAGNVMFKDIHHSCDPGVKRPPLPLQVSFNAHRVSDQALEHTY